MPSLRIIVCSTAFSALLTTAASAASITLTNPSFEDDTVPPGFPAYPIVTGWETPGPATGELYPGGPVVNAQNGFFPNTADGQPDHIDNLTGNQAAYLGAVTGNEFRQTVPGGIKFQAGQNYTLSVDLGHNHGGGNESFRPDPTATVTLGIYYAQVDAGHLLASLAVPRGVTGQPGSLSSTHLVERSVSTGDIPLGSLAVNQSIIVSLVSASPANNSGGQFDLDNVRLTVVPEPGSASLAFLGALAWAGRRRRR